MASLDSTKHGSDTRLAKGKKREGEGYCKHRLSDLEITVKKAYISRKFFRTKQ